MSQEIGTFTPEQARLIWQDYQSRSLLKPSLQNNTRNRLPLPQSTVLRTGVTIGTITAATSVLTGETTFTFALLQKNASGDLADTGDRLTGTNRDTTLTALDGTVIICAYVDGEWRPVWVGCEPDAAVTGLT